MKRPGGTQWLRLSRHVDMVPETIDQVHAFVAKFQDGHEEILLYVGNRPKLNAALRPERLKTARRSAAQILKQRHDVVSVRLASFYAQP